MKKEDNKTNDIVVAEPSSVNLVGNPQDRLKQGHEAAKALMSVAQPVMIQGNKYLTIHDWQTVGAFYGFFAGADDAQPVVVDGVSGFRAKAVVRTSDGTVVSSAIAYCFDEGIWKGREKFAQASMAQTRACSKSLRMVVGWVAVLGGYKDTPAEEMDFTDKPIQSQTKPSTNGNISSNGLECPECKGGLWDNRVEDIDGKKIINEKKHPAFKCRDTKCTFVTWECDPKKAGVLQDGFVDEMTPGEVDELVEEYKHDEIRQAIEEVVGNADQAMPK